VIRRVVEGGEVGKKKKVRDIARKESRERGGRVDYVAEGVETRTTKESVSKPGVTKLKVTKLKQNCAQ